MENTLRARLAVEGGARSRELWCLEDSRTACGPSRGRSQSTAEAAQAEPTDTCQRRAGGRAQHRRAHGARHREPRELVYQRTWVLFIKGR